MLTDLLRAADQIRWTKKIERPDPADWVCKTPVCQKDLDDKDATQIQEAG
jgi:hypothetical protein